MSGIRNQAEAGQAFCGDATAHAPKNLGKALESGRLP
jgi:hypothetical protein